jgi:RNA polymerase sigma-70 factor (ECF subfamily)
MADLEQLTAPEISVALGIKLNTVYSRVRLARRALARALDRYRRGAP